MRIRVERNDGMFRVSINEPRPIVKFSFSGVEVSVKELPEELLILESTSPIHIRGYEGVKGIIVQRKLGLDEHVYGLGEKAFDLDRRRATYQLWNTDVAAVTKYGWYIDPMYVNVPFLMIVRKDGVVGYLFNSASRILVDVGMRIYDKLTAFVPEESLELYIFSGKNVEEVLEKYTELTGRPFLIPEWALGYQISRYSYYPQDRVLEIVKRHLDNGFKVSVVYLDIDYMDSYKMFTWDSNKFPDPRQLTNELHRFGVRVITIFDPCLRVDQNYELFKEALGLFVETGKGEIFTGPMWPGVCAWIDFGNPKAREWWAEKVRDWVSRYGVDGIWLDMNEPAVLGRVTKDSTIEETAMHNLSDRRVTHAQFHNAYAYYEAIATQEGLRRASLEPFILSRAGFAGIQSFAAVWTGDNIPSWDDLKLQVVLALGLSISGIPYVGCDLGGFAGRQWGGVGPTDLDLLVRYYQVALFFPVFRSHGAPDNIDKELYNLPRPWADKVREVIRLRYEFLPYLSALALEAHERGHPILRPLVYY
ncbi:MAG: TIM-barrel domain-containing protein, partial [Vulcanisaeta sp. AZ3]